MEYFHPAFTLFIDSDQIDNFLQTHQFMKVQSALESMMAKNKSKEKLRYIEIEPRK